MKTKITLFSLISLFYLTLFVSLTSNAQQWSQLKGSEIDASKNDPGIASSRAVVSDNNGNTIIGGRFLYDVTFGLYGDMVSPSYFNGFVTKFTKSGSLVFSKELEGQENECSALATDGNNNIYVAGYYKGTKITSFGGQITYLTGNNTSTTQNGFLMKFDSNGYFLWSKSFGDNNFDAKIRALKVDANGNIIVCGHNLYRGYISKISSDGTTIWEYYTSESDGNELTTFKALDIDPSGNIYTAGLSYCPTITVGATTLTNYDNSSNTCDMIMFKFNSSGSVVWAKNWGGNDSDGISTLNTDASGNSYITGPVNSSSASFGSFSFTNTSSKHSDGFIAKINSSGTFQWVKQISGLKDETPNSSVLDNKGNLFVAGSFSSATSTFGTSNINNFATDSTLDCFFAKYNTSGTLASVERAGNASSDAIYATCLENTGNIIITGMYATSITLGTTTLTTPNLKYQAFYAKYGSSTPTAIANLQNSNSIQISPNPVSDILNIEINGDKPTHYDILNITGEVVCRGDITDKATISTSNLSAGTYIIKLTSNENVAIRKFIKE